MTRTAPASKSAPRGEPEWLAIARNYLGTREVPGAKHNNVIVGFFRRVTGQSLSDETAWCAAFVGSCLKEAGLVGTGKLNARSYLTWGAKLARPRLGCIVVFKRGSSSWQGHVAFYLGETASHVEVLGGNQPDAVTIARYPKSALLGYRWPQEAAEEEDEPQPDLKLVQQQLRTLGYFEVGRIDGLWGKRTRDALNAFRDDQDPPLPRSNHLDDETLAALMRGKPREVAPERLMASSAEVEAEVGHHAAIRQTRKVSWLAKIAGAIGLGGIGSETGLLDQAEFVSDWTHRAWALVEPVWPVLQPLWPVALLGGAWLVYRWMHDVRREEVDAYKSGEIS